ncbi:MinD/ParA family ATP-binding protein [Mycobacterium colombiense]|uniref:MinD/ParA family ATP-binding protein n=1 Tax=Mycobacterium colombiense TaxID=339268 RepID=UPI00200B1110|nr:MinD/ParA family protein [Mycobacterium colombiense]MCK8647199.1 MinD/ParA family protein [Mycobacterium colombiense]
MTGPPQPPPAVPPPPPPVPPPPRPEPMLGATALDRFDAHDTDAAGFNWRQLIYRLTGIEIGPGKNTAYENELRERIRATVGGAFPIAVLNLKGGVGKTTVVEALGSTFAAVRDDRVLALDIDAGDLAERHGRRNPHSIADLLQGKPAAQYEDIRALTYMNGFGLEVLGLPDSNWRLERHDMLRAFSMLRNQYSLVLVDCVKTLNSGVMDAVLPESRALVVVTSPAIDAVRKTRATLDWLCHNGYQSLMQWTVLAVNHVEPAKVDGVAVTELDRLSARVGATVVLPFDRHVHDGRKIALDRLSKESRRSYLEMAAVLADMFPGRGGQRDRYPGSPRTG